MAAGRYYDYTIRSRETGEVLFQGGIGRCAEFLGCGRATITCMARKNKTATQGFFNSRYEVTRTPEKTRGRKYYKVYKDGKLVVEGSSWDCAAVLGVSHKSWYQLAQYSSFGWTDYVITSELK